MFDSKILDQWSNENSAQNNKKLSVIYLKFLIYHETIGTHWNPKS